MRPGPGSAHGETTWHAHSLTCWQVLQARRPTTRPPLLCNDHLPCAPATALVRTPLRCPGILASWRAMSAFTGTHSRAAPNRGAQQQHVQRACLRSQRMRRGALARTWGLPRRPQARPENLRQGGRARHGRLACERLSLGCGANPPPPALMSSAVLESASAAPLVFSACTSRSRRRWQPAQTSRNSAHMPNMAASGKEDTCRTHAGAAVRQAGARGRRRRGARAARARARCGCLLARGGAAPRPPACAPARCAGGAAAACRTSARRLRALPQRCAASIRHAHAHAAAARRAAAQTARHARRGTRRDTRRRSL